MPQEDLDRLAAMPALLSGAINFVSGSIINLPSPASEGWKGVG